MIYIAGVTFNDISQLVGYWQCNAWRFYFMMKLTTSSHNRIGSVFQFKLSLSPILTFVSSLF